MRLWGEDAAVLARAGADVDVLARLERDVDAGLARLGRVDALDAHCHLGRDADGHRLDAGRLLADLDRWGIAAAVCFPANDPGHDGQFGRANAAILEAARRADGRLVPFCRVDPGRPGATRAMELAAAGGARGLKLHPVAQRLRLEGPGVAAAVRDATERGWPVTIHAGYGARPVAGPVEALLEAVPGARLILAHAGRGDARAVGRLLARWPLLMLDTALAALPDLVAAPPERLLFGSDRPYGDHAAALTLVDAAARAAGWDADRVAAVMGGNMRALLAGAPVPV
jgi:predicted TIM-barrel fold metal-dependent hydrolase